MSNSIIWAGMDVHKENINVAVLDDHGYVKARWAISNSSKSLGQLAKRLTGMGKPRCVYEAGPCWYDVRRFLESRGIDCEGVAPSLIPRKPGDRVKDNQRDAEKLARMYRAGELTPILVPTHEQEALFPVSDIGTLGLLEVTLLARKRA